MILRKKGLGAAFFHFLLSELWYTPLHKTTQHQAPNGRHLRQIHQSILEASLNLEPHPKTLLDIGSGSGISTHMLSASLPKTHITALDQKLPLNLDSKISFVSGKAEKLPFVESSFDVITASLSLHHWQDKKKGISEAFRVLRKGGYLIIGDPLLDGPLRFRFLGWLAQVTDGGTFTAPNELKEYLTQAGFSGIEISAVPSSFNTLYLVSAQKC